VPDWRPARVLKPSPQRTFPAGNSSRESGEVGDVPSSKAEATTPRADTPIGRTDDVAVHVRRECAEQGIPVAIDDPMTIDKIMTLMRDGRASKSATKVARSARRGRPSSSAKGR
jgi:hypothetical protein